MGEAKASSSLIRLQSTGDGVGGNQGEVVALRTSFPHTSGKLVS